MSKTKRCIDCPVGAEQWEDEVCVACGRCEDHCQAPHRLVFDAKAVAADERPHPLAGQTWEFASFTPPAREDPDRARTTILASPHRESGGLQSAQQLAIRSRSDPVAEGGAGDVARSGDDDGGAANSLRRERQHSKAIASPKRRDSGRHSSSS